MNTDYTFCDMIAGYALLIFWIVAGVWFFLSRESLENKYKKIKDRNKHNKTPIK